ncbi:hypothetical protein KBD08_02755 [Candidatus Babeliales bacterium]|nr:hypothetical protein [Candidatus Babeliales bacterium]
MKNLNKISLKIMSFFLFGIAPSAAFAAAKPVLAVSGYEDILSEAKIKLNCSKDISLIEHGDSDCYARAYGNEISINRKLLNDAPLGFRRMTIFHETVHIKHNDYLVNNHLKQCTLFVGAGISYAILRNINDPLLRAAISIFVGAGSAVIATEQHSKFMETRADTKAANALGCETCLHEFNDYLEQARIAENVNEATRTNHGYLSVSQITEIIKRFKNQRCLYHNEQS